MPRQKTELSSEEGAQIKAESKPKKKMKYFFKIFIFIVIAGLVGTTAYYYKQYKKIKNNPQVVSQEETQAVVAEVGKLMELPNETPSIATVQDKDKLKDQNFFQKAQNGDKVLIYTNAKQAILFRPSAKKIIEVAPLLLPGNDNNAGTTQDNKDNQNNNNQENTQQNQ